MHDNSEEYFRLKYLKYKAKYLKLTEELEGGYADDKVRTYIGEIISGLTKIKANKIKAGGLQFNTGKRSLNFQLPKAVLHKINIVNKKTDTNKDAPGSVLDVNIQTRFGLDAFPLVRYVDFLLMSRKQIITLIQSSTDTQLPEDELTKIEDLIKQCYGILGKEKIENSSRLKDIPRLDGSIEAHVENLNKYSKELLDDIVKLIKSYNPPIE